jgi:lipopolysaccharide transport protein LptA/LPS export ABC transporter protein LptC
MSPATLRAAVAAGALALLAGVALSLRRPPPVAAPTPGPGSGTSAETRTKGLVYRNFREGRERWSLTAAGMAGKQGEATRLQEVAFVSNYVSQGETSTLTIKSDECAYTEALERAVFKGNVKVTTADGFEVDTETLTYRGDRGVAKSDDPAQFHRREITGSSTGVEYQSEAGRIVLPADVKFRIANDNGPPAEIVSQRALALRERGALRFEGAVSVAQGPDTLKADELTLNFDEAQHVILRAVAIGSVDFRTSGAGIVPGASGGPAAQSGPRVLKARKLDIGLRPDHTMEQALASGDAELTILPAPGGRKERKRLKGRLLRFAFDEQGRVQRVGGQKDTALVVEPLVRGAAETQTALASRFLARLDPATGELQRVDFKKDVSFTRGTQTATAAKARYTGSEQMLWLAGNPKLDQEGNELTAAVIELSTESGDLSAKDNVHHLLRRQAASARSGLLSGKDAPTLITSASFHYESKSKTARYERSALLRSGKDEVRAPTLLIQEDGSGNRSLTGTLGVVSLLNPPADRPGEKRPSPLEARAAEMAYDELAGRITYTGDVTIRQGDIATKSPKAVMTMTPDGAGIEKLVSGEPVEVQQAGRKATGTQGVYTPGNETMILTGDNVVLVDKERRTAGHSLTFHVGDDRILVEGREEGRTETILKKESPPP